MNRKQIRRLNQYKRDSERKRDRKFKTERWPESVYTSDESNFKDISLPPTKNTTSKDNERDKAYKSQKQSENKSNIISITRSKSHLLIYPRIPTAMKGEILNHKF